MKTDNELIAEFMGFTFKNDGFTRPGGIYNNPDGSGGLFVEEMQYHASWDWLMPVVQKLNTVENDRLWADLEDALCTMNIREVYKACVEFIKWHNQQKA